MMKKLLLISLLLNLYFVMAQIPQRIIFIQKELKDNENKIIQEYIKNEINKVLEILDSELIIRYSKEKEYNKDIALLLSLTKENMQKFYFNTNIRGGISFEIIEEDINFLINIELYNFNEVSIKKEKFFINKNNIIENITEFNNFLKKIISTNFPKIKQQKIYQEKFSILKIIREMPEFSLTIKGEVGYKGKNINDNLEQESYTKYHNGLNIGIGIEGKIKLFHIGTTINFSPYIVLDRNEFWFDLSLYSDIGIYLIQEILLIKNFGIIGILSNYSYKPEKSHMLIGTFLSGIEIGALPTKYLYPFFAIGIGFNFFNMPETTDFLPKLFFNTVLFFRITMKFGFQFYFKNNFFIGINSFMVIPLGGENVSYKINDKEYTYNPQSMINSITINFGYRFDRFERKKR